MWLTPYRDPTLAELAARESIHGGGGISASLLQPPRNQWAELVNQVAPIIRDYVQRKKSDEIANQYLRQVNSPFAGSGAAAVPYQDKYRAYLNDQPDTATDDLNFLKLWQQTHPEESPGEDGMTPYQREQTRLREIEINRKMDKDQSQLPPGISREIYNASKRQDFDPAQAFRDAQERARPSATVPSPPDESLPQPSSVDTTPVANSKAERDALPSGTIYIGPDGKRHRKP